MKPSHWVYCTVLLTRTLPNLCWKKTPVGSYRQCRQPTFPLLYHHTAQCRAQHTTGALLKRAHLSTMSQSGLDYSQYRIQCLKDLGPQEPMDVIVAGQRRGAREHVIFFGGDVQDYPENMQSHRDNGKYIRWNSLTTAERLCERFPSAMVLVVKPHHMHLKTFSVYSQFVQSNDFGCPTHTPDFGAWRRLASVYAEAVGMAMLPERSASTAPGIQNNTDANSNAGSASKKLKGDSGQSESSSCGVQSDGITAAQDPSANVSVSPNKLTDKTSVNVEVPLHKTSVNVEVPLHLIGFSKGCIVLNQLLHELETVKDDGIVQSFISKITAMTWLDGGHSGGSNTWVTDPIVLQRLAAFPVDIHVHVTPYQVKDQMRRWIGKEKRRFVELLQKAGARVTDTLHFEDEPKSIENHFRVLEVF